MSDITISQSVRSNLLNLQQTSDLIARTQERLSTGRKVNSALDNPTNFFTASSLNSRASDLSNLLDGLSNGIKTIEAADNGLKAITRNIETLQSTVRQARQDKSFQTETFKFDNVTTGQLSFSGGAVGATAVNIDLTSGTPATETTLTGAGANYGSFGGATININGTEVTLGQDVTASPNTATAAGGPDQATDDSNISGETGTVTLTAADGTSVSHTLDGDPTVSELTTALGTSGFTATATGAGFTFARADGQAITIETSNAALATAIGQVGSDAAGGLTVDTGTVAYDANSVSLSDTINTALSAAGVTNVAARDNGGQIELFSSTGEDITVSGAAADLAAVGFGNGSATSVTSDNGTEAVDAKTVDDVIREINNNDDLKGKVRASNVNGQLRIENLSTAELSIDGIDADGDIDGATTGEATIGGNSTRNNLVSQFNDLRQQLDRLADDAGFNGINLLRGDRLRLSFNESGTSSIDIQAKDASGNEREINSETLNIRTATSEDFGDDAVLDQYLGELGDALTEIRAQASAFGANLSTVQNRQDFTKETINTLQTGADNLTLADINEEAANLLSLQTRQQLSNTSLSLANQADQGVLRLF